jgi:hypothetical protein
VNIVYGAVWLPWALAFAMLSTRRRSLLPHPGLPIVLALQFGGGYAQGAAYIVGAVALYYGFCVAWPERNTQAGRSRPIMQLAVLGGITFGLSAVQALPLLRLSLDISRTLGLSYERAASGGWGPSDLSTLFFPFTGIGASAPYRVLSHRVAYVGLSLALLAPFAWFDRSRRREVVFFGVLTGVAIAFALGRYLPVYRLHYFLFPGFRIPGRILFLATLGVGILGAIGLERLVTLASERNIRSLLRGAACSAILVLASGVVVYVNSRTDVRPPMHAWPWVLALTMTALVATLALSMRWPRAAAVPVLCVLAFDLTAFATGGAETVPITPVATVEEWLGPSDGGRVITFCDRNISSTELLLAHRPSIEGPIGVTLRGYEAWRRELGAANWPSDALGQLRIRRDLMNLAGISTVVSCEPITAPSLTLVSVHESVYVYRNVDAWPRVTWACGSESLSHDGLIRRLRDARYDAGRRLATERVINVRWAPDVDDARRQALEQRYELREAVGHEDRTWRYPLGNSSSENLMALLRDPAVEDTAGIDRGNAKIIDDVGGTGNAADVLIGTGRCDPRAAASLTSAEQPDGRVSAAVENLADGILFFSEPFYSERRAYVDGRRTEIFRANIGFTAVPVPAGKHVVEIRIVPTSFYAGLALTMATVMIWIACAIRLRRSPR